MVIHHTRHQLPEGTAVALGKDSWRMSCEGRGGTSRGREMEKVRPYPEEHTVRQEVNTLSLGFPVRKGRGGR